MKELHTQENEIIAETTEKPSLARNQMVFTEKNHLVTGSRLFRDHWVTS